MTVDYHIRQLLYRNDCVIIPAFGAFLVKRISAKVHVEDNLLEAPKRVLSFNPQLKNDDGLLVAYVAEAQKISYKQAQQQVETFVEDLTNAIRRKNELLVEDLGKFSFNTEGFLSFEPIPTKNYLLSSFGLEDSSIERVSATAILVQEEEKQVEVITLSKKEDKEETSAFGWAKYAAVFVGVTAVAGLLGWQYQTHQYTQQEQMALQRVDEKVQHHIQEANFSITPFTSPVEIELPKEELHHPFHVVGGAFRSQENALKKVSQLQSLGYQAKEIGQNKYGLYQVVYQSFLTREEAMLSLNNIRLEHNPNAWLLVE